MPTVEGKSLKEITGKNTGAVIMPSDPNIWIGCWGEIIGPPTNVNPLKIQYDAKGSMTAKIEEKPDIDTLHEVYTAIRERGWEDAPRVEKVFEIKGRIIVITFKGWE